MLNIEDSKTIEMLAFTVAHEVKNPLSLIKANIDYMELCDKERIHTDCYRVMKNEIEKANDIIMKFIEYAKPVIFPKEKVDVSSIIDKIILNYESLTHNNIHFCIKNSISPYVQGQFEKIKILFNNVLKNAVESVLENNIDKKIIEIDYSIYKDFITINIVDNGVGLSKETLSNIEQKLCYTTKANGSGIGINICKRIVLDHGGTYSIKNICGGGVVVSITLPQYNF
jgi:nitrogen fixation/metabolism regulation signal transduction histidine kinase